MKNYSLVLISIVVLLGALGQPVSAADVNVDLGLGTGFSSPETVSFNSRFLADISLKQSPNSRFFATIRPEIAPSSFIGIQVISMSLSLLGEYDAGRINPFLGVGAGMISMNTSVGSSSDSTLHGLAGVKLTGQGRLLSEYLDFFAQAKLRTHPTENYQFVFEMGFMY